MHPNDMISDLVRDAVIIEPRYMDAHGRYTLSFMSKVWDDAESGLTYEDCAERYGLNRNQISGIMQRRNEEMK